MARPPRIGEWEAITARVSLDSAKRLRIAAARRGVTTGAILDEIIQSVLPPDDAPAFGVDTVARVGLPAAPEWSVASLKREMERRAMSQSDLARLLDLTPRSVNAWFISGRIPEQRQAQLSQVLKGLKGTLRSGR